jgi:hypothetical protein
MVLPAAAWLVLAGTARAGEPAPAKKEAALDARALANRINAHVQARWKAANVKPAPVADDAEFLRRVYLDIAGRIPRVQEIHQFLQDKRPDKRFLLIDKLLEDHGYVGNFTNIWRDLMIPQANNQFAQAFGPQMEAWLGRKLRENVPYDKIVRELLTADPIGNRGIVRPGQQRQVSTDPAVLAFYQANELKPENLASSTSRIFLGVRLECAQCHDHPFAAFTRDQFWQYAAFFAGIRPFQQQQGRFQPASYDPSIYEIKIPNSKPERTVKAKFLDGKDPKFAKDVDARALLAEWMTAADNPFFAKAAVNRLWAHFFGLGIIDPVDEPNPDNPPSHPELLDELAKQFALNKFDLKYLIKAIAYSDAYQRTSRQTHPTQADPRLFARMSVKGLSPEQLYDSLVLAVGYRDPNTTFNRGFVGNRFFGLQGEFRTKFANHADKRTEFQTSILQALSMMNGSFTADATSVTRSNTLAGVIDSPFMDTEGKLNALFLASLGRKMHPAEVSRLVRYVDKGGPSGDSAKALSDVFWALLNSSEFMFNH